jgi:hypothetical protein
MATITKVCRKSGDAYKAVIRLRGSKPFSKTFKLRKYAKAWAERMERDIEASRAYGNAAARTMTLGELIRHFIQNNPKGSTPFPRTVLRRLKSSDPAWPLYAASSDCETARCN